MRVHALIAGRHATAALKDQTRLRFALRAVSCRCILAAVGHK